MGDRPFGAWAYRRKQPIGRGFDIKAMALVRRKLCVSLLSVLAGEEIEVEVRFSVGIQVDRFASPTLALDVGGAERGPVTFPIPAGFDGVTLTIRWLGESQS